MLLHILLPAWSQLIGLKVGIHDEFPTVSWLCHLHLLIEDFLPFTSGQAGRHGSNETAEEIQIPLELTV